MFIPQFVMNKINVIKILLLVLVSSCSSKKDILYFQDVKGQESQNITYENLKIQPNDILSIVVDAAIPEAAYAYNKQSSSQAVNVNLDVLKLQGYLVSNNWDIEFPVLGKINVFGKTVEDLEILIQEKLEEGKHLVAPLISIRILNSKVTILGEVKSPGTYSFTEQNISLPQALGYAGDLTINGKREDITIIREIDGIRNIKHIDLTKSNWFNSSYYYIKPNDVIVVNPNIAKVKSAGFIGNSGTILTIASLVLTSIVLITR